MKNISLILNIVLILAVALLYIDRFSGGSDDAEGSNMGTKSGSNADVVYINIDSLMNSYDLYNELQTQLMQEQQQSEANLNSKVKGYQRRAMEFQQKVEKRLVTTAQAEQMQQQLIGEQQNLAQLKDELQMKLMDKQQQMTKQIYDQLTSYLKKYNGSKKHKIILGNTMGNVVLQADSTLDITNSILEGLNKEYQNKAISDNNEDENKEADN